MNHKPCDLPWTHLYYHTDGNVYPCPLLVGNRDYKLGSNENTIDELWNNSILKKLRIELLSGAPPKECINKCYKHFNACHDIYTDALRQDAERQRGITSKDGRCEPNHTLWYVLESNKCNLKCVYCSPGCSSSHAGYVKKALPVDYTRIYDVNKNVVEIWFSSGEPILQPSTYSILKDLIAKDKVDVKIRLITNLTNTHYRGETPYTLLEQFTDVKVFGSWDADGIQGENIRVNSNSDTIKNNIKFIKRHNIDFYLVSVMSILNIEDYPDFHKRLYSEGLIKKDQVRYFNLTHPEHFRYSILPLKIKERIKVKLLEYKNWLSDSTDTYPNNCHPCKAIDKIINCMMTGEGGHLGFSEENNTMWYMEFLKWKKLKQHNSHIKEKSLVDIAPDLSYP